MCWTPLYPNINKLRKSTRAILQTTGGKDKPNIFFMRNSLRISQKEHRS